MKCHVLPILLASLAVSCTQAKESAVREPALSAKDANLPADSPVQETAPSRKNDAGLTKLMAAEDGSVPSLNALGLRLRPGNSPCVVLDGTEAPCYEKLEALFEAVPDLGVRARKNQQATVQLAQIVHAFKRHRASNSGRVNVEFRLVKARGEAKASFEEWLGKPNIEELSRWRADTKSSVPTLKSIGVPHWQGKHFFATALILERGRKELEVNKPEWESYLSIRAVEYQIDFTAAPTFQHRVLPTKTHSLASHAKVVAQIFGGPVDAFVRIPFEERYLLVAIGPKKNAKRFVVQEKGKVAQTFVDWPDITSVYPGARNHRTLSKLTDTIFWFFTYRSYQRHHFIEDAAAYKKLYKEEGRHEEKLRYWHDEFRHTIWEVPQFDRIADPRVKDGKLVIFSTVDGDGREPMRLVIDLANLQLDSKVEVTSMFRRKVLQDTGNPSNVDTKRPLLRPLRD